MSLASLSTSARGRTLALALLLAGLACPAVASSITSDSFVAIVQPTADFLEAAGRLAETNAGSARIRAFARLEIRDGTAAQGAIVDWRAAERRRDARNAAEPTVDRIGPLAGIVNTPFDTLADFTARISPPLTGLPSADHLRAVDQADLARLATLQGHDFDVLYTAQQIDRLVLLERTYEDFIKNGDDPDLRALAVHRLPAVRGLLARARRL